jgi:hypothetical protein
LKDPENLQTALAAEAFRIADWSKAPIDQYVQRFNAAATIQARDEALNGLGFLAKASAAANA